MDDWFNALPAQKQSALQDEAAFEAELLNVLPEARLLKFLDQFFFDSFITLAEKTRSIIDFTFSGFLFRLLREPFIHCSAAMTPMNPKA